MEGRREGGRARTYEDDEALRFRRFCGGGVGGLAGDWRFRVIGFEAGGDGWAVVVACCLRRFLLGPLPLLRRLL